MNGKESYKWMILVNFRIVYSSSAAPQVIVYIMLVRLIRWNVSTLRYIAHKLRLVHIDYSAVDCVSIQVISKVNHKFYLAFGAVSWFHVLVGFFNWILFRAVFFFLLPSSSLLCFFNAALFFSALLLTKKKCAVFDVSKEKNRSIIAKF